MSGSAPTGERIQHTQHPQNRQVTSVSVDLRDFDTPSSAVVSVGTPVTLVRATSPPVPTRPPVPGRAEGEGTDRVGPKKDGGVGAYLCGQGTWDRWLCGPVRGRPEGPRPEYDRRDTGPTARRSGTGRRATGTSVSADGSA